MLEVIEKYANMIFDHIYWKTLIEKYIDINIISWLIKSNIKCHLKIENNDIQT